MLSLHNVYSTKVQFFFDSTKGFLDYFTFRCVFYAFRGQSDFAVGLSVSDKLSVLNSIPIALRHHDAIMELSITLWLSFFILLIIFQRFSSDGQLLLLRCHRVWLFWQCSFSSRSLSFSSFNLAFSL